MNVHSTRLPDVLLIEPRVFEDERGYFFEAWNADRYRAHGIDVDFVQDNISWSKRGVIRGLHYQNPEPQGKLVTVLSGSVFDVAVDLRAGSPTFGEWAAAALTSENRRQLWIPPGHAHGFAVLSDSALFSYKCQGRYLPANDRAIRWDDPDLDIGWPIEHPILSAKDAAAPRLRDLREDEFFVFEPATIEATPIMPSPAG